MVPLTQLNLSRLCSAQRQFEFEIFHAEPTDSVKKMGMTPHLIGIAFVDVSHLSVMDSSSTLITGYYHIVDPGQIRNSQEINYVQPAAMLK